LPGKQKTAMKIEKAAGDKKIKQQLHRIIKRQAPKFIRQKKKNLKRPFFLEHETNH
jgi:hypothetical protein